MKPTHLKTLRKLAIFCLLFAIFAIQGCETMDGAYNAVNSKINPRAYVLKTSHKWLARQANLDPVPAAKMTLYFRMRNSSGSDLDEVELQDLIKNAFASKGYTITNDISKAQYYLNADIRHFGETTGNDDAKILRGGSALGGAIAGAVIGNAVSGSRHAGGVGAVAGGVVAYGGIEILRGRNKPIKFSIVLDLQIGERIEGGVTTTNSTDNRQNIGQAAGAIGESGSSSTNQQQTQSLTRKKDFLHHKNTAITSAIKMNLMLDEATPAIYKKLTRSLSNTLP